MLKFIKKKNKYLYKVLQNIRIPWASRPTEKIDSSLGANSILFIIFLSGKSFWPIYTNLFNCSMKVKITIYFLSLFSLLDWITKCPSRFILRVWKEVYSSNSFNGRMVWMSELSVNWLFILYILSKFSNPSSELYLLSRK